MDASRFDRNIRFFGEAGQQRLRDSKVGVVGVGGIGSPVVQELALLGVGTLVVVDDQELAQTDRNRYVGARHDDPIPGTRKVDMSERLVRSIDPGIVVTKVAADLLSLDALSRLKQVDYIIGCLDTDGPRLVLTELAAAYSIPYLDAATDIIVDGRTRYGGRVCVAKASDGCLVCMGVIDPEQAGLELADPEARRDRETIYGIDRNQLERGGAGPSVISLNGVIASLAVTEFLVDVTGLRAPKRLLSYRADLGIVTTTKDEPSEECYYCKVIRGQGDAMNVERFVRR